MTGRKYLSCFGCLAAKTSGKMGGVVCKSSQSIRVLIADDHPAVREGIRAVLEKVVDMEVVGETGEGRAVKELVATLQPDILLLDLIMPGPRAADIARWVRNYYPETVTLILTAHDRDAFLAEMEQAGAVGYLTKEEDFPTLVAALRRAVQGEVLFSGEHLWRAHRWRQEVGARWESLTAREQEVAQLLAQGARNRQLAARLGISEHTVETHVGQILRKLEMASRTAVVAWLWEHSLVVGKSGAGGNQPAEDG